MLTASYSAEVQQMVNDLYEEGRHGDMWCEAQAQCLESWLECGDEYTDDDFQDDIVESLSYKTQDWLEGHMDNYTEEQLAPGGLYHWMRQALM